MPTDHAIFELESAPLQSGVDFRGVKVSYKTYGQLAADKSNVVVVPSGYTLTHDEVDWLTSVGKVLDPSNYFIISVSTLGNGLSSSPSNSLPPFDAKRYPRITLADNVRMQQRLVTEVFGIQRIALVWGWSMGGQQAYHWGALFPDMVERICVVCGSARTSVYNLLYLAGLESALKADPLWRDEWFAAPPVRGLKAFARVTAGWVFGPAFYREEHYRTLGFPTLEEFLVGVAESYTLTLDANNLLAQLWTWQTEAARVVRWGNAGNIEGMAWRAGKTGRSLIQLRRAEGPCVTATSHSAGETWWRVDTGAIASNTPSRRTSA